MRISELEFRRVLSRSGGGRAVARAIDVRQGGSVRACFDGFVAEAGRLDMLVSVAGITSTGSFEAIPEEDRKSVVEGTSVSVRVDLGGRRIIKKKKKFIHSASVKQ